jgi:hypothetical protein
MTSLCSVSHLYIALPSVVVLNVIMLNVVAPQNVERDMLVRVVLHNTLMSRCNYLRKKVITPHYKRSGPNVMKILSP